MKIFNLILALALMVILANCSQISENETERKVQEGWKSLNEDNYSINYPENWELNRSQQMGTNFMLFSPLSSKQDQFKENVNLLVQDLSGLNLNLDQFVELSEGQITTLITDGTIISSNRKMKDNREYQRMIYTGKQGIFDLKFEQFYWIIDKQAFILTLTCEEKEFDKYKGTGEVILNSFVIK